MSTPNLVISDLGNGKLSVAANGYGPGNGNQFNDSVFLVTRENAEIALSSDDSVTLVLKSIFAAEVVSGGAPVVSLCVAGNTNTNANALVVDRVDAPGGQSAADLTNGTDLFKAIAALL